MSSIVRPPDPCLIGIILIVRSRAGPRFVFHYPPNPLSENGLRPPPSKGRRASRSKSAQGSKSNDSSSSDETGSTSDEDEEENQYHLAGSGMSTTRRMSNFGVDDRHHHHHHHHHPLSASLMASASVGGGEASQSQRPGSLGSGRALFRKRGPNSDVEEDTGAASERQDDPSSAGGPFTPPWETLLGLPADVWEKLLSPSRSWHKRRFEVGINDLAFVGWPVFVREDGAWQKQRRKKKSKRRSEAYGREGESHDESADDREESVEAMANSTDTLISPRAMPSPELKRTSRTSSKQPRNSGGVVDGDDKDSMTMFNVVFVLDPPLLEYSIRLREVYDNIIKKFAKALKWEQARTDYVWREAQNISHLKEKAKETRSSANGLYSDLISHSSLARAIYTLYTSISSSKIASLSLSADVSISLQIPPLTSTHYLPGPTDKAYPGLWLTTADSVTPVDDPTADENTAPHQVLAKHFALLLLDNEASIIKDVEASASALAPALVHYIRCSKPTQSFAQISTASGISLSTIQMLASHLVYWRRARAIPPLHHRDTYIVSPNCDMSKLDVATAAFHQAFPTCPSLPKMLSALSGTPRPYGSFIPSKDHKDTYFSILAWLLRGGWVTQLRSFGRIKVPPEIKMAVERAIRTEEMNKFLGETGPSTVSDGDRALPTEDAREYGEHDDNVDASSSSSSSLGSQGSGEETPMPGRYHDAMANEMHLSHSLMDHNMPLRTASLILSPHRASPLESRWLDEIVSQFPDNGEVQSFDTTRGSEISLQKAWPTFIKYFNGYDALEKIPVREGLKRKPTWQVLTRLGVGAGQSHVKLDPREQVLVSVRHW